MTKKIIALVLALALCFALAACGGDSSSSAGSSGGSTGGSTGGSAGGSTGGDAADLPTYHFKFSIPQKEGDPAYIAAEGLIKAIEERSEGKITFDFYPAGELGGMADVLEMVKQGADVMTLSGADWMASLITDYAVTLPYITEDPTEFSILFTSEWFEGKVEEGTDYNVRILDGNWFAGYRSFNSTFEINTVDDVVGKKVRVLGNELLSNIIGDMGAIPTGIELADSYTAIQNGLLDATEGVASTLWSQAFYDYGAKYITATRHSAAFCVCILPEDIYQGMPEEYQTLLTEAAREYGKSYTAASIEAETSYWGKMVDEKGCELNDTLDLSTFKAATVPVAEQMGWSADILQEMQDAIAAGK